MVKGYEFAKDQYVMFTPEELKAMEEAGTHTAEITEFVPIESVDPVYFDKAYYLAPDKGGAKPYALLAEALRESEALRARPLGRARQAVHRDDPPGRATASSCSSSCTPAKCARSSEIEIPKTEVKDAGAEARAAADRAADLRRRSIRAQYTDEVRARIEAAMQKKVEGQEITMAEAPETGGAQVIDLMEALRASLEKKAPPREGAPRQRGAQAAKRARSRAAAPATRKARARSSGRRGSRDAPVRRARRREAAAPAAQHDPRARSTPASSRRRAARAARGASRSRT